MYIALEYNMKKIYSLKLAHLRAMARILSKMVPDPLNTFASVGHKVTKG
jgi:hypothetical protein